MHSSVALLHIGDAMSHNRNVAASTAVRIGVLNLDRRMTAAQAVFYRPSLCMPSMGGPGRGALAHAGFLSSRYANPVMCPPTPIGVGSGFTDSIGGLHG